MLEKPKEVKVKEILNDSRSIFIKLKNPKITNNFAFLKLTNDQVILSVAYDLDRALFKIKDLLEFNKIINDIKSGSYLNIFSLDLESLKTHIIYNENNQSLADEYCNILQEDFDHQGSIEINSKYFVITNSEELIVYEGTDNNLAGNVQNEIPLDPIEIYLNL